MDGMLSFPHIPSPSNLLLLQDYEVNWSMDLDLLGRGVRTWKGRDIQGCCPRMGLPGVNHTRLPLSEVTSLGGLGGWGLTFTSSSPAILGA